MIDPPHRLAPMKLVDLKTKCSTCGQTLRSAMMMPLDYVADEVVVNVVICPFDEEEGRNYMARGISLYYERAALT